MSVGGKLSGAMHSLKYVNDIHKEMDLLSQTHDGIDGRNAKRYRGNKSV